MTRLEKCILAVELGFTYNENTGEITTPSGKILKKKTKNGYLMLTLRGVCRKPYYLLAHQFAYWIIHKKTVKCIDHIDRIKTNNSKLNLRSVSKSQNAMNMKNVRGVSFCKRSQKWIARIMVNYKTKQLGSFDKEKDALKCYLDNKHKYHII